MKKYLLLTTLSCCIAANAQVSAPVIDCPHADDQTVALIKNPSFEEEATPIRNRRFGPNGEGELFGGRLPAGIIPGWIMVNGEATAAKMGVTTENLLDAMQQKALQWVITEASATTPSTIANVGHHGIDVVEGNSYTLTFWARADKKYKGKVRVGLQSKSSDGTWYAQAKVKGKIKKRWKKYTLTFTATQSDENSRFVISADRSGTLYFDCVSLYPSEANKR